MYTPLEVYLTKLKLEGRREILLTFKQIEELLNTDLPPTAKARQQWWGNENLATTKHEQCKAWQNAGWTAKPDLGAQRVLFVRE